MIFIYDVCIHLRNKRNMAQRAIFLGVLSITMRQYI